MKDWLLFLLGLLLGQKHTSQNEQGNTQNKDARINPERTVAELRTPVPISVRAETHAKKDNWEKAKTASEIIGVTLVLLYVIFTYRIMRASIDSAVTAKSAADTARKTLIASQRPWVGLGGPIIPSRFQLTSEVSIQTTIPLKNFGASPALKVMAEMRPIDHSKLHDAASRACDLVLRLVNGTIPENQLQGPQLKRGFTLFPNESISESITTGDSTIKPGSVDTLYFVGCIAYRDQFEQVHTTHFCVETPWLAKTYKIGQPLIACSVYNEAD